MMNKLLGLSLALLALPAFAGDLRYTYVEVGYQDIELDDFSVDGDGFSIRGSFELTEDWFMIVGYQAADFDFGIDFDHAYLGAGYRVPINDRVDLFGAVAYLTADVSADGFDSIDEDGFGLTVGVRGLVTEQLELAGSIGYSDLGDGVDGTAVSAGALYSFTEVFALGIEIELDEELTAFGIGARFYFGD
jgi:hypothetical protein